MIEARYYTIEENAVRCGLCPHRCRIYDGAAGICGVRKNDNGRLVADAYAQVVSTSMDPIEKKPLYHFHPGTDIFSVGSVGCNFNCRFCQNYTISQSRPPTQQFSPEELVATARQSGSDGIAYTYNEPLINFEYVLESCRIAKQQGLWNVLVTNGFINPEPLGELLPATDAANIDLKSIRPDFYTRLCGGRLEPVLDTIQAASRAIHLEITNLVIPEENDADTDLEDLAAWIAEKTGPDTPLHLSAYFPRYRLNRPATTAECLQRASEICGRHLRYVYLGNVMISDAGDTRCPDCGSRMISRRGYHVSLLGLDRDMKCTECGRPFPGVTGAGSR